MTFSTLEKAAGWLVATLTGAGVNTAEADGAGVPGAVRITDLCGAGKPDYNHYHRFNLLHINLCRASLIARPIMI